jgi:hypothetical protein
MSRPTKGKAKRVTKSFSLDKEAIRLLGKHFGGGEASEFVNGLILDTLGDPGFVKSLFLNRKAEKKAKK